MRGPSASSTCALGSQEWLSRDVKEKVASATGCASSLRICHASRYAAGVGCGFFFVSSEATRFARRVTSALRGSGVVADATRDGWDPHDFTAKALPRTTHVASNTAPGLKSFFSFERSVCPRFTQKLATTAVAASRARASASKSAHRRWSGVVRVSSPSEKKTSLVARRVSAGSAIHQHPESFSPHSKSVCATSESRQLSSQYIDTTQKRHGVGATETARWQK